MSLAKLIDNEKLSSFAQKFKANIKSDLLGGKKIRYVTTSEYNALTSAQKNDTGIVYHITDVSSAPTIVYITQSEYDALSSIDPSVLYIIV